jgi:hypothetical protein
MWEPLIGCVRCKNQNCPGQCGILPHFTTVFSHFQLTPTVYESLLLCKKQWGKNHPAVFSHIHHVWLNTMQNLQTFYCDLYPTDSTVYLVMPYKPQRIRQLDWHPNMYWECCIPKAYSSLWHTPKQKMSSIAKNQRYSVQNKITEYIWQAPTKPLLADTPTHVVLLDDLLTTGTTASIFQNILLKKYPPWQQAQWAIHSFFRS